MMTREGDILYQNGRFWIVKAARGFEVYEDGITHATRKAIIGWDGAAGLKRAIAEADRRAAG